MSEAKKLALDLLLLLVKCIIHVYDFITLPYFYITMNVAKTRKLYDETPFARQDNPNDPNSPWRLTNVELEHREIERQIDSFKNYPQMMQWSFKKNAKFTCYGFRELISERFVPKQGSTQILTNSSNSNNNNNNNIKNTGLQQQQQVTTTTTLTPPPSLQTPQGDLKTSGGVVEPTRLQRQAKLTDYKWFTFSQFECQIEAAARGFLAEGVRANDRVMLYSDTRAEWQIALQALLRIEATVCTMYATLGFDGIVHSVNETKVSHVVAQADKVSKLLRLKHKLPTLKKVIFFEPTLRMPASMGGVDEFKVEDESELERHALEGKPAMAPDVECVSFNRVLLKGYKLTQDKNDASNDNSDDTDDALNSKATLNSPAIIMYTSGSTGVPKGVIITHGNIMATVKSFSYVTKDFVRKPLDNTNCAYLPLAHIFEFCIESMCLYHGVKFGFASPQTLTDSSPGLMPGTRGDLTLLKPTVIIMVPLVLDRVATGIKAAIKARGYFKEQLVNYMLDYKASWARKRYDTPLMNKLLCEKFASALGGRIKFIICGSAPLSASTQTFVRFALNAKLPQGFGTTETCAATTCQLFDDYTTSNVGPPVANALVKLEEWPEAGYSPSDKPNPRGEIVVGGDMIAHSYFELAAQTKEAFYNDENGIRWYRTGDIGEFLPNGNLKIIDRKKDLVKLQNGEYISLGKVESTLKSNPFTENFCVFANSLHNYTVALAPVNELAIVNLARELVELHCKRSNSGSNLNTINDEQLTNNNNNIRNLTTTSEQKQQNVNNDDAENNDNNDEAIEELRSLLLAIDKANNENNNYLLTTSNENNNLVPPQQADCNAHERLQRLCSNKLITSRVLAHLCEMARERNLLSLEIPKKIMLLADEWTEEQNLVTAAMKIRRNFIYQRYESELNALYA